MNLLPLAWVVLAAAADPAVEGPATVAPQPPREEVAPATAPSLRASLDGVVARDVPRFVEAERRRLTLGGSWLGVGGYRPVGARDVSGYADFKSAPLDLYPRAGLGNSLSINPITGKRY